MERRLSRNSVKRGKYFLTDKIIIAAEKSGSMFKERDSMKKNNRTDMAESANAAEKYRLSITAYGFGGGLAINILQKEDGVYESWGSLTVNLSEVCDVNAAYIDVSNGFEILTELLKHNMGKLTGKRARSGYVLYPEFLFNEDKLRQADEKGYEMYLEQCDREHIGMAKIYGTCSVCHETYVFYVTQKQREQYEAYLDGEGFIQDIFSDMDPPDRELLRGRSMCKNCWTAMFGEPDQ